MQAIKPVTKPTKQRKMLYKAPNHVRHKLFATSLSPELRTSQGVKAIPVRSGDTVRIMRGDNKGFEGKVTRIDRKKYRIHVEGLTREKVDGTAIFVPIHPSKVMITRLNLDDKWRKKILERKKETRKELAEVVEKPPEEVVEVKEEVIEEKAPLKKKPKRKKRKIVKPVAEKVKKKAEEAKKEAKSKVKKTKAKRKIVKKTEGGT